MAGTDLLPCPFCGGEDLDVHAGVIAGRRHECVTITCNDCVGSIYGGTEERAIEAWNTRAERTCKRITLGLEREREIATVSWICSACGKHMNSDHDYCPNCGAKVVNE